MTYDFLVVGAGFSGAVLAERIANELNKKVLIVDKRNHIGGNCYDYYNENGILVHKYGPHIFHTNSKEIISYLSNFTEWKPYFHKVLAVIEGKKVSIPFNINSIYKLFPKKYANKLENELISRFGYGEKIPILKLRETTSGILEQLAKYIYDNVFYGYTLKQWALKPEDLDSSVSARVPVYICRDNRYFQDNFQQMPKYGYSKLFEKMLFNKNIHILLHANYKDIIENLRFDKMIFTGQIDEYFDYIHGNLPYRSLEFKFETFDSNSHYQETAQINYPNNYNYTRITEFSYLTSQDLNKTTVAFEYPKPFLNNIDQIPYYPIPRKANADIYNKYLSETKKLKSVIFCGRLADYKYYNMDQVIARALSKFKTEISN